MTRCLVVDACHNTPNYNYCLLDALQRQGAEVIYATTEFAYTEVPRVDGVQELRCFFWLARNVGRVFPARGLRRVLRGIEYPLDLLVMLAYVWWRRVDVVHLTWLVFPTLDLWSVRCLRWMGKRVVFTAHNALPHEERPADRARYRRIYAAVDHIIVLTQFVRRQVAEVFPGADEKLSVIVHGDYEPLFAQLEENSELAAEVREQAGGRRVVAFLGAIRPYKGVDWFCECMRPIQSRVPDVLFLVAGNPLLADRDGLKERLRQSVAASDLRADIRYVPLEDLIAYVHVMDVLVQPYLEASQSGNTVMAYAAGVPVISTDVGGLSEMVLPGETGYLVPPRDTDAMVEAVAKCLDAERYQRLSARALELAQTEFSWAKIGKQTLDVYRG